MPGKLRNRPADLLLFIHKAPLSVPAARNGAFFFCAVHTLSASSAPASLVLFSIGLHKRTAAPPASAAKGIVLPFLPTAPAFARKEAQIMIPRRSRGYFIFGRSPHITGRPHVGIGCLPARIGYLLPVNGSRGSNKLSWSVSLSTFSWFLIYSLIAAVFFPVVST